MTTAPDDAAAKIEALRRGFAARLPARIDTLDAAVRAAAQAKSPETIKAALSHAHRLAGVAGSYGFIEVGEAAAVLERELMSATPDWTAVLGALQQVRARVGTL